MVTSLRGFALGMVALVGLGHCDGSQPLSRPTVPLRPETIASPARTRAATVQEVVARPVWVSLAQGPPTAAYAGLEMAYGDQIRTEDQALAEGQLVTGPVFRIGGNASLTLRPNQQLQFDAGQMITWVEGQPPGPVEILTPVGIAGLRGTTAFVNIPPDPQAPVEIFSWEGEVSIRPNGARSEIILTSGEQLLLRLGEQDVAALQARVRRLDRATARQRLSNSPLINDFSQPLPTRPQIEAALERLE
ncbi:MAG TPA: FecR domain-containing protein [Leptolyngbyaceae cyanobacterium M65_K2018_010]|nr:FecR domain-containing protein [Leptolyngbyaceae cyanobacterium M65_K2018_010]